MSEIEKMYENCNIKPKQEGYCDWDSDCPYPDIIGNGCGDECPYWKYEDEAKYPPFTTEKQIELIKLLAKGEVKINNEDGEYEFSDFGVVSDFSSFEESLADFTNRIWQDLTEEEKQQVKGILK